MKKVLVSIPLAFVAGLPGISIATNGDTLIGIGAKTRGMGGTGVALSHGAESALSNPALLSKIQGTEVSFGGTIFQPTIETGYVLPAGSPSMPSYESDAGPSLIPAVSIAHKINENWYTGVGMWGTAGMGTDFRKAPTSPSGGNQHMVTNLQLMQFGVPVAYKTGSLSLGLIPILQYGNLDINYLDFEGNSTGSGLSQDYGSGYQLGAVYDFSKNGLEGLTFGVDYKSSIELTYDGQLSTATQPFADQGIFPAALADDLEQPAELAFGLAYDMGQHTFAFDLKKIKWSDAKGYKDFNWKDQDVYALGYQFAQNNWTFRLGYNNGSSAVEEVPGAAEASPSAGAASALNFFNLLGFPATSEKHYTVGGGYKLSDTFSVDLAYVHSPESEKTFSIAAFDTTLGLPEGTGAKIQNTHSENSVSIQLNYAF
jgi:long-chain fatty acid transport protein